MLRLKSKPIKRNNRNAAKHKATASSRKPFIEHIYELRKRLFFVALAILIGGGGAYAIQTQLTAILIKPAGDQQFIYTSPGGGFDFIFKLCLYGGILFAIPVIVWQLLRYLQPLMKHGALRFIAWGSVASAILAMIGIAFGYFYGLPAAMHFLLQGFSTKQIEALISIQSYMSFVMMYLVGSALLFQVPLVMVLINRIKPLKPGSLMRFQRWFIVIAFILGAIINPSPNIQDQLMLSVPMILMYQLGIIIVWFMNRGHRKAQKVHALLAADEAARMARQAQFEQAQDHWVSNVSGGAVARSAPSQRTWQEPPTPLQTPKPILPSSSVVRPQVFTANTERRSYQNISVTQAD